MLNKLIKFFLHNRLVSYLLLFFMVMWGLVNAPFDYGIDFLPRDSIGIDAIPDIGENQQIVFTKWQGRSPQDVEDQISFPLTTSLLGIPGVKSVRSNSMFGFSSIYIVFDDDIDFYWSRSRILEKLNALPANTLPPEVKPSLGPDATGLGQIFWYTLEGRDKDGNATGGWDPQELRTIQDFYVRYGLSAVKGVSEVASIGGYVKEYQVNIDADKLKANNISLQQLMDAVRKSNLDIGAQTLEINMAEYFVRGLGYIKSISDIEESVVAVHNNVPIKIKDLAVVNIGPATRRGALDKSGAEATGGVVVSRYGSNPLEVIDNIKAKIKELEAGLPQKELANGVVSQVKIIPFYDRSELIKETIGTLQEALTLEILITIIVVILMLFNIKSSLLISSTLPVAVLMVFIAMKFFGIEANIVALSGIAIAIGTMVDMGIVLVENMNRKLKEAPPNQSHLETIYEATSEVASAILTAVATTIVSFLPILTMEAAEGKMFKPLVYTKTFALAASIFVAITILPTLAHDLFSKKYSKHWIQTLTNLLLIVAGVFLAMNYNYHLGLAAIALGLLELGSQFLRLKRIDTNRNLFLVFKNICYALIVGYFLAREWMPLGVSQSVLVNFIFIIILCGGLIGMFFIVIHFYETVLRFLLRFKIPFLVIPIILVFVGFNIMQNAGKEFMPKLDEGSFLLMPTSMPHAGMQENMKNLRLLDMAVTAIPEVRSVVGKLGRVESPLDPAPISMYENIILYHSEYKTDENGYRQRFKTDKDGAFVLDEYDQPIPDERGQYYRQWRDHIKSTDDIWNEIVKVTKLPGVTSAPKLQPIETRLIMLATGMRAPMGIKVYGPDLETIQGFSLKLETILKNVEGVKESAVFADRIVGKPYMQLEINRNEIARHGLTIKDVQNYIQASIGGMKMTETVEGRERYAVTVRYPRELRSSPDDIKNILIPTLTGAQIPLGDLVEVTFERGPQSIKSEDGFLVAYVLFDKEDGYAEGAVVDQIKDKLDKLIADQELKVPTGIKYKFAGNYEQQERANKKLSLVLPIVLMIIFLILYFEFKSIAVALMVFSGVFVAFSGGFIMLWLYGQPGFMDFEVFGTNIRDLFDIHQLNLSVAVWVGFLALFGIATDDGVLVATYLRDQFKEKNPTTKAEIRNAVVEAGKRRVRPAMMTSATTILALLPVLSSSGRGSGIMIPMAIPSFGGMILAIVTMFVVPVLYAMWKEWGLWIKNQNL